MRRLLITVMFIFLTIPVFAQQPAEEQYIEANDFGFSFYAGFIYSEPMEMNIAKCLGINMIYHPTNFLSIEPSFFVTYTDSKETSYLGAGGTDSDKYLMLGGSLGLFYYHHFGSNFYLYVGPRVNYMREDSSGDDASGSTSERKGFYWGVTATIGLKYLFNDHVGIFGDFGFGYLRHESTRKTWNSTGTLTTDRRYEDNYWSGVSANLGVTLYF